jgi:hypothetical protein
MRCRSCTTCTTGTLSLAASVFSATLGVGMVLTFGMRGFSRAALLAPGAPDVTDLLGMVGLRMRDLPPRAVLWGLGGFAAAPSALVFAAVRLSLGSFLPLMGLGVVLAAVAPTRAPSVRRCSPTPCGTS